jgi:hypothetical protein
LARRAILILILCLSAGSAAWAASELVEFARVHHIKHLKGRAVGQNGAGVAGATIEVVDHDSRKLFATGKTDDKGRFYMPEIPAGYYDVKISASGFNSSLYHVRLSIWHAWWELKVEMFAAK